VWWYKWIGRSMETNGVTVDLAAMLKECLQDVRTSAKRTPAPQVGNHDEA
jgi:hypothetical protein